MTHSNLVRSRNLMYYRGCPNPLAFKTYWEYDHAYIYIYIYSYIGMLEYKVGASGGRFRDFINDRLCRHM